MRKNVLGVTLLLISAISVFFAIYFHELAHLAEQRGTEIEQECRDMKSNSDIERDRQYQMVVHLSKENDELKQRLKNCAKRPDHE
jgi:hypothetical protein